jgi:asparagine synthase (glutamine-hydrolysing)
MSVQFGTWNLDGQPLSREYVERAAGALIPYGPDGENSYSKSGLTIVHRAFRTTKESRNESQPHVCESGAIVTWDGRLDNRDELREQLSAILEYDCPDVSIVAAAYAQWGIPCLSRLIGDWAVSIWIPEDQSLILAKDPIGTCPLYYEHSNTKITWSSVLDPLVLFADRSFDLSDEYIAGWLSFFPATHLTPYVGICSVPPSSFVHVTRKGITVSKYWDFDAGKRIRYGTDDEYEEHFRTAFGQAVRRRLRSDEPVMAELSGGMDSSSIVCMADRLIEAGRAETPRLETISYYCDSEPNWNERAYFATVEKQRGCIGFHINLGEQQEPLFNRDHQYFAVTPGALGSADLRFADCMRAGGYRVVLSGVGGDEITGGVPTPTPELEDLLARGRLRVLAHQVMAWALDRRKPWLHLLAEAMQGFLPPALRSVPQYMQPVNWLRAEFAKRHRLALSSYPSRLKVWGPLPSFQENLATLEVLRRQLGCGAAPHNPHYEKRYPYLDRSFLEFVYAVPREQLVRPGQRRSLMRRSLVGIVPDEILLRKRKAFVIRSPMASISRDSTNLVALCSDMIANSMGIVDADTFRMAIQRAASGHEIPVVTLLRTLDLEFWLRGLTRTKGRSDVYCSIRESQKNRSNAGFAAGIVN